MPATYRGWICLLAALPLPAAAAEAQADRPGHRVHVAGGAGVVASGAYFTGPGDVELASGTAGAGQLQLSVAVHPRLAVVAAGVYARPDWELSGIPLVGSVGVSGATLMFADVGLRGFAPLGSTGGAPTAFAQLGAGLARYSLDAAVLGFAVDEQATNFALAIGGGLIVPLTARFGLEVLVKDYIASFTSVRDLEEFGVEGQRAHTVLGLVSARVGL